jgi:hypothetical protein
MGIAESKSMAENGQHANNVISNCFGDLLSPAAESSFWPHPPP